MEEENDPGISHSTILEDVVDLIDPEEIADDFRWQVEDFVDDAMTLPKTLFIN